jgi:hypothetical protein
MVTDEQVRTLRKLSNTEKNEEIAASKAGMDPTTARRYRRLERLPSELKKERPWRTREDPFSEVWEAVQRQIQESPGLEPKTLFEWLRREYTGRFNDGQIRRLQRRIKLWRVTLCASDFTHMTEQGITLKGQTFEHLVYQFVLTYSNWETGTICYSESLESLSEGWQNAAWELGAVPAAHRTDSLSSAVNNMSNREEFNQRYERLMKYYGVKPQHTNPAGPNENGMPSRAITGRRWTWPASTNCAWTCRCSNERGGRRTPGADRAPQGFAPADGAGVLRGHGAAGGTGDLELYLGGPTARSFLASAT